MLRSSLLYALRHKREWMFNSLRDTISWTSVIITLAASLLALLPISSPAGQWIHQAGLFLWNSPIWFILLFISIILIACVANWPRMYTFYKDSKTDLRVIIECCDLFQQSGLKVIHTVDTFDTELDRIISPHSLHGAFLQRTARLSQDIDTQLDTALKRVQADSIDDSLPGRTTRYPLGTIIPLSIRGEQYCFAAFTHLQQDGSIRITRREYIRFLTSLWKNLASPTLRQEQINVAIMGNHFVDLPADFSTEQKIDIMIQTFFAVARQKACCKTLHICVHETNAQEIDFTHYATIIEHLAKRPIL